MENELIYRLNQIRFKIKDLIKKYKKNKKSEPQKKRSFNKEKIKLVLERIGKVVIRQLKFRMAHMKKYPHIYLFPLTMVYFEILLRIFSGTSVFAHFIYPVLFGVSAGLLVTFLTSIFKRKINRRISVAVLFVTGLIFIIECFIKRSFQWYMPLTGAFSGAGDVAENYGSEVFSAIIHGIPVIIFFLLPGILYVIFGKKYMPARTLKLKRALRYMGYSVVCMLVAVGLANVGSSAAKYESQFKYDVATEYFGLLTSTRLDIKYAILGNDAAEAFVVEEAVEEEEEEIVYTEKNEMDLNLEEVSASTSNEEIKQLNEYVETLKPSSQNKYTGLFEGKNLILICAEALSDAVISEELTPTLYRMTHNGFYFSDYYQPTWGGSTTSGEFSFLLGLVPLKTDQSMTATQGYNLYFSLGNQLQREGYYSAAYHNGTYDYYSRQLTHNNLGYSTWLGQGNGLEDITGDYPDDEKFFDLTMDTYIDSEKPFSIYYMTVSGHCVYKEDGRYTEENLEYVRSIVGDKYKDTTTYYLCYQMELEYALTTMIEKLEAAGIADDTVICLTSDHYPYGLEDTETFGNSEDYVSDLYGYDPTTSWENDHNSLIIWSGCLENENKDMACEISTPTYSLDIVPTLSNLFGLEYDSRLLVGRDVFSDAEPLVIWNNYSWVTTEGKYDSAEDVFYPNEGVTVGESYVERIKNVVSNKITFSRNAMNNDYYGVLFGKDTIE